MAAAPSTPRAIAALLKRIRQGDEPNASRILDIPIEHLQDEKLVPAEDLEIACATGVCKVASAIGLGDINKTRATIKKLNRLPPSRITTKLITEMGVIWTALAHGPHLTVLEPALFAPHYPQLASLLTRETATWGQTLSPEGKAWLIALAQAHIKQRIHNQKARI